MGLFVFLGSLSYPLDGCGVLYIPPPQVCPGITLTGRPSAPWVPAGPVLTLFFNAFGSSQGELLYFSSSYCTTFHVSACVHYEYTLKIHILTLYLVFATVFMQYSVHFLTAPVSLALEAPVLLCAFPRSPVRSAEVFRLAVQLVPVPSLPCHKLLLRQILSSRSCRADCSVC